MTLNYIEMSVLSCVFKEAKGRTSSNGYIIEGFLVELCKRTCAGKEATRYKIYIKLILFGSIIIKECEHNDYFMLAL